MGGRGGSAKGSDSGSRSGGSESGETVSRGDLSGYRQAVTVAGVVFDSVSSSLSGCVSSGGRRGRTEDHRPEEDEAEGRS